MADPDAQPAAATPSSERRESSYSGIIVALIAAMAAVVGALAGGFATYLGNKSLQETQSRSVAVGVARVLQTRLLLGESRFQIMLDTGILLPPDPGIGQIIPSTQDEETLASNLNAGDWNKVSVALSVYELFTERAVLGDSAAQQAGSGLRVPLGRDRGVVKADRPTPRLAV
jgi:hypothetical protein